jgi:hypothetical protein
MKTMILITLSLLIPFSVLAFSGKGSGTEEDPYQITNVQQLQEMKDDLDGHYILMNDIDASETRNWNIGDHDDNPETPDSAMGFEPVGSYENEFSGNFNGNGFIVRSIYINSPQHDYVGLFGFTFYGNLESVYIENCNITGGYSVGGLCGSAQNNITNCYSTGIVKGINAVGGLIGALCEFSVETGYGEINSCFSGSVVQGYLSVGGFVGSAGNFFAEGGTIENSYSTATVEGNSHIGGFVGSRWRVYITNCYSIGSVVGKTSLAGFGSGDNCYWDIETSGIDSSWCVEGKTTTEMMTQSTFVDWDFDEVWCMVEGKTYPHLRSIEDCDNLVSVELIPQFTDISTHPNPFSLSTIINYELREAGHISLELFDMLGNKVATLVDDWQEAGQHEIRFDGSCLPAGMYFYVLRAGKRVESGKIVHIK